MPMVERARGMHAAGWTPTEIQRVFVRETGLCPAVKTIRCWVFPKYQAKSAAAVTLKNRRVSDGKRLARMVEFRRRGMSYRGISIAASVLWGVELSVGQVRLRVAAAKETE